MIEEPLSEESIQELLQELEEEQTVERPLSPDVEEHLSVLLSGKLRLARKKAAEQLGSVGTSSPRIVQALTAACRSDTHSLVRRAAATALRAPVHQECLQNHPKLSEVAESALQDFAASDRGRDERQRHPRDSSPEPAILLAPSELVLLKGDRFAAERVFGERVELITVHAAVDARALGEMMLATAFLANEQAGAVHLVVRQRTVLFGLLKPDELYVVPGEQTVSWPAHSFESRLHPTARRLQAEAGTDRNHVSEIVSRWLNGEYRRPWEEIANLAHAGLARRGLLERDRRTGLKRLFHGEHGHVLPGQTAALAREQSLEPIWQLLATCRQTRPEVWRLLVRRINNGISSCRESSYSP
jgi:hypothetical protein